MYPEIVPQTARDHWLEEQRSAFLYRALATSESPSPARDLFAKLAGEAEAQAAVWAARLDAVPPAYRADVRARLVAAIAARIGARRARPILRAAKVRGLSALDAPVPGHPLPARVEDVGARHRTVSSGNLRAAVFGASDGLVSNTSLVLGVAGAASDPHAVLLAGTAGLLAGAFSMASGEWISVRSQREMSERQLAAERDELREYPDAEARELALVYEARGLSPTEAQALADRIVARPEHAIEVLAREELGIDPNDLVSPWGAALSSFVAFALGAIVPLVPLLVVDGTLAIAASAVLAATAMFGIGAITSLFTGGGALSSGLRMLTVGALAGGATYLLGRGLGVAVS